jgi:hypothetical protein
MTEPAALLQRVQAIQHGPNELTGNRRSFVKNRRLKDVPKLGNVLQDAPPLFIFG